MISNKDLLIKKKETPKYTGNIQGLCSEDSVLQSPDLYICIVCVCVCVCLHSFCNPLIYMYTCVCVRACKNCFYVRIKVKSTAEYPEFHRSVFGWFYFV